MQKLLLFWNKLYISPKLLISDNFPLGHDYAVPVDKHDSD